ncbi:HMCT-like protein [Mya arenaria]|uniref:HMCT-like protein n=1 Tax=Mya arenaria TaxID=6604 RepID=A0ABY7F013_MYAAR|nr:HMCT-like protein [Mya arenaria]
MRELQMSLSPTSNFTNKTMEANEANKPYKVLNRTRLPITTTIAPNTLPTGSPTPRRLDLGTSTTTPHPNQTFVTPPNLPPTLTECKEPRWTNWMNSVKPVDGNDIEYLPALVKSFGFCREDQIAYTQCRRVSDKLSFDVTGDLQTVCSTKAGFACYGSNQPDGRCDDYEFRVYCQCENSVCDKQLISDVRSVGDTQFTASTSGSGSTAAMARLDSVSGWRAASGDRTPWVQVNFQEPVTVAGVITQAVKDGSAYTSKYTLSYSSFNCSNFQTYTATDGIPMELSYSEITQVPNGGFFTSTPHMPSPNGHVTGISTVSTNMTKPMPYICVPGWTPFMSVDTPGAFNTWEKSGPGDTEPITELRNLYGFCAKPTGIQCRTKVDKLPYTMSMNFDTVCNLEKGFECLNSAQGGMECGDYEVSFQCDCGTTPQFQTTIPSVTGTPSAPKPACGWTNFINSYLRTPTSTGDYETIHNVRMKYEFCEFPVRIECRDTETKQDFTTISQAGVSCDVNRGLVCEDKGQSGGKCKDYEIRLYCVDACSSTKLIPPGQPTGYSTLPLSGQATGTPTMTPPGQETGMPTLTPPGLATGTTTLTPQGQATNAPTLIPPGQHTGTPTLTPPGKVIALPTLAPPGQATGKPTLTPPDHATGMPTLTPAGQGTVTPTLTPHGKATNTRTLTPDVPGAWGTPSLTPPGQGIGTSTLTPPDHATGMPTLTPAGQGTVTPTLTPHGKATNTRTLTPGAPGTLGTPSFTPPGQGIGISTLTPPDHATGTPTLTPAGQGTVTPTLTPNGKATNTRTLTPDVPGAWGTPSLTSPGQGIGTSTLTPPDHATGTPTLTPAGQGTVTPTLTPHGKVTNTRTRTPGAPGAWGTPSLTPPGQGIGTSTLTPPDHATGTPTLTPAGQGTVTPTLTPHGKATNTRTLTPGAPGTWGTPSLTPPGQGIGTSTLTPPDHATGTPSLTPAGQGTVTPTLAPHGKATNTRTLTPDVPGAWGTPSLTPPGQGIGTSTLTPPDHATGMPTLTPAGQGTVTPTLTPHGKATNTRTRTPGAPGAWGTPSFTPPGQDIGTSTLLPPGQATGTPTLTPPGQATGTPTLTPQGKAIGTPTLKPPGQATGTPTLIPTGQATGSPTLLPPGQATGTRTLTPPSKGTGKQTLIPPGQATGTPTLTPLGKGSGKPTLTPPGQATETPTLTPSGKGTGTPTLTQPGQATETSTYTSPGQATPSTLTPPGQASGSPTPTPPGQASGSPTPTPPGQASGSPTPTPPGQASGSPTPTPPGQASGSPTPTPPGQASGSPTPTPPGQASGSPTPTPPGQASGSPTLTPPGQVTASPTFAQSSTRSTLEPSMICKEGWTDWINFGIPAKSEGDFETYTSIRGYPNTCEEVVAAECQIASTGQNYMYSGQDVSCSPEGLMCEDGPSQKCVDYKIKFFCSCQTELTTPSVTTIVKPPPGMDSGTPTMTPPSQNTGTTGKYNCTQGWTSAMSVTTSAITGDELETITDLRRKYKFCDDEMIVSIRCADLISDKTAEELGQKVTCDMTEGLICKGADQAGGKCADYTVQFYCDCEASMMTTTLAPPIIPGGTPALRPPYHEQVTPTLKSTSHPGETTVTPRRSCDIPLGVTDRQIVSDSQLSASTSFNFTFETTNGRLMQQPSGTNGGAWMPRFFDTQQFIQVDFGQPEKISGVVTQGRQDTDQWVESFLIETSLDGIHWYKYADRDSKKAYTIFPANFDRNTPVKSFFDREVDAQYVRIVPMTWNDKIVLRFDVLSCYGRSKTPSPGHFTTDRPTVTTPTSVEPTPPPCKRCIRLILTLILICILCLEPMGIDNPMLVKDGQLTSSSNLDSMHGAAAGRLYNEFTGWAPVSTSGKQWLQVDLLEPRYVSGILTQGIPDKDMWSVQYVVSFSNDGYTFTAYSEKNGGLPMLFNANNDRNSIVKMMFNRNIVGRYVRVTPIEGGWAGIGLRFNLIGCFNISTTAPPMTTQTVVPPTLSFALPNITTPIIVPPTQILPVCTIPMGIGNRYIIRANQISASSSLDIEPISFGSSGIKLPWTPVPTDLHPYVQVDFLEPKTLSGVLIQGSPYKSEWVTSYQVYTSLDGNTWTPYSDIVNAKIPTTFKGNKDNTGEVTNLFNRNIYGRFIRIYPISFHTAATLMFEILGCNPSEAVNMTTTVSPSGVSTLTPTVSPPAGSKNTPTITPPSQTGTPTTLGFGQTVPITTPTYVAPPTVCLTPMGLEYTRTVFDRQITSSSKMNELTGATQGRIHSNSSWIPSLNDSSPWIQVNFEKPKLLSGILTQGENGGQRWVTKYTVDFSMDGKTFYPYTLLLGDPKPVVFSGNNDSNSLVRQLFNRNVTAQYIRIHPKEWHGNAAAIRFNIIGCNPDSPQTPTVTTPICTVPMGVANTLIVKDQQLSASSSNDMFSGAERSRFDAQKDGSFYGGWVAGENNIKQYIQVDFLAPYYVGGIKTEGRSDKDQWVTKYEIYYSTDGKHYSALPKSYMDSSPMVFTGNKDSGTPVANLFNLVAALTGTRTPGTGTATGTRPASIVSPTACAYWTPWVSAGKPDKEGEYESAWQLKQLITFCDYQYVQQTECRTTGTHIPYDQTGENGVICNNDLKGLLCYAKNQSDSSCLDYEIRVFCDECASTPAVTTPAPKTCNPRWLPWINNMTPTNEMSYVEHEFMSLQKQQELCFDGKITRFECQTIYGVSFHSAGTVGSTCEILSGLTCKNSDNYPVPCDDFQVRYYCDCAPMF